MRKTGFIGFGSMGSIMLKALLDAGALSQEQVILYNRTQAKLNSFRKQYLGVEISKSPVDMAPECENIHLYRNF